LRDMIKTIIDSQAKEMFQRKKDTYNSKFDCMCEEVLQCVKRSQQDRDKSCMEKTIQKFQQHEHEGSLKLDSSMGGDSESDNSQTFFLPDEKMLCRTFAAKGDFEEQLCRKFLREIVLGQLIQKTTEFAEKAYEVFVEERIKEVMSFFTEGMALTQPVEQLLENSMASYEREYGERCDAVLELRRQKRGKKREAAAKLAEQFVETAESSIEDFQDFRTVRSLLSKRAYTSMYVGIVVIEASPLLEAMIMPLIQNGGSEYQNMIDVALNWYRNNYDDVDLAEREPSQNQPVWKFRLGDDWVPYAHEHQALIEDALKNKKTALKLEIEGKYYMLRFQADDWYQVNMKTGGARLFRREPPPPKELGSCAIM